MLGFILDKVCPTLKDAWWWDPLQKSGEPP